MRDHNYTQAQSTLQDLQNQLQDPQSPASNNLSSGLKDVLNSASCSQTGCSVNWSQVKDMIKPDTTDQIGVPKGLAGNSPGSA
ncbi:MAG TPA: hypothetical protein VE177_05455, partial [Candidatus Binatus sp.]|nr:hypothetical protein [Candidatus Binatus sp.]